MELFDRSHVANDVLSVSHCNASLYHFWDIWCWRIFWPWNKVTGQSPCQFTHDLYIAEIWKDLALSCCCWQWWSIFIQFYTASSRRKQL